MNKQEKLWKDEVRVLNHTKEYIHISFGNIVRFFLFFLSVGLSVMNFMLIISIGKIHNVGDSIDSNVNQLIILCPLIVEYILIGLSMICLFALIKGGFNKLNSYKEEGLISGLILGLILGLISGLISGLILGLISGLINGLFLGLNLGLFSGINRE